MRNLLVVLIASLCLVVMPFQAQAKPTKTTKAAQLAKERLVLMPLRLGEEDQKLQGAMEMALVKGLQQKYEVFFGEQVAKKAREIFMKESQNTAHKECDETRCLQGIAEAFQAELLATANITKQSDGYFIALSVQNLFDNKVVQSESVPCKGCDAYAVIDKLKELVGAPAPVAIVPAAEEPQAKINLSDPETVLWEEVKKGNAIEDYQAYLSQYPKGKFISLAKTKLARLKEEARAASEQQDQQAWTTAQQANTQDSFANYLEAYPKGQFAVLAQGRIDKIKRKAAAEAKQKREVAVAAAQAPQPGKVFKDCAGCPDMVEVPAGSFSMGSSKGGDESPAHTVTIRQPFAMGKTEITRGQFAAFMNATGYDAGNECYVLADNKWKKRAGNNWRNPGFQQDDSHPVVCINWNDATAYVEWLSRKTGKQYRLPTESQWEYTCRAGGQNEYCGSDDLDSIAWYGRKAGDTTQPSARKQANAFGLYDMSGNVLEWMADSYHDNYNGAPTDGSEWQGDGAKRVLRGGSWYFDPLNTRSAFRISISPAARNSSRGFRVSRTLP